MKPPQAVVTLLYCFNDLGSPKGKTEEAIREWVGGIHDEGVDVPVVSARNMAYAMKYVNSKKGWNGVIVSVRTDGKTDMEWVVNHG